MCSIYYSTYHKEALSVLLSLQSLRKLPPLKDRIIWRPVYRFAIQIRGLASVWLEIFLEVICSQTDCNFNFNINVNVTADS